MGLRRQKRKDSLAEQLATGKQPPTGLVGSFVAEARTAATVDINLRIAIVASYRTAGTAVAVPGP